MKLPELICKVVGHTWDFPKCVRCGLVQVMNVYVNGLLMRPSADYTESGKGVVTFKEVPRAGSRIDFTIGMSNSMWGRNEFDADGGTTTFTAYSYYGE